MTISVPDGDYDQEVVLVVDGYGTSHVMVVTYRDGRPVAIRNPWGDDPAMPCSRELAEQLCGMPRAHDARS